MDPRWTLVESRSVVKLNTDVINKWRALATRALESNPVFSPDFVIPAIRHLLPNENFIFMALLDQRADQYIAVAIFEQVNPSLPSPWPRLRLFRSIHSACACVWVDKHHVLPAMRELMLHLKQHYRWHIIEMQRWPWLGENKNAVRETLRDLGVRWHEQFSTTRSLLRPAEAGPEYLQNRVSKNQNSNVKRKSSRLAEKGPVSWRVVWDKVDKNTVQTFLELEHSGWKQEEKTALLANPADAAFFTEIVERFAVQNGVFFTELLCNGVVISSTCNFLVGRHGLAFKLAWAQEYAAYSVGRINEYELVKNAPALMPDTDYLDSGAAADSFMDDYWKDRRHLYNGAFSLNHITHFYLMLTIDARAMLGRYKRAIKNAVFALTVVTSESQLYLGEFADFMPV